MKQPDLFTVGDVLSPACIYETHCGHRAVAGKPVRVTEHCENTRLTCRACRRVSVRSVNLTLTRGKA